MTEKNSTYFINPKSIIHNFEDSNKIGTAGEELTLHLCYEIEELRRKYKLDSCETYVLPVSKEKEYQKLDIDFLVMHQNKLLYSLEVKTDTYDSGNIFLETISNTQWETQGCFFKTRADYLLYYLPFAGKYLEIPTAIAQRWLYECSGSFKSKDWKEVYNKDKSTGKSKKTRGLAVNIEKFVSDVNVFYGTDRFVKIWNIPKLIKPEDKSEIGNCLFTQLHLLRKHI